MLILLSLPTLGLIVALFGAPVLLLASRRFGVDPFSLWTRAGLWVLAATVVTIAVVSVDDWRNGLGLASNPVYAVVTGSIAGLVILAGWPVLQRLQRRLGGSMAANTTLLESLAALSPSRRALLVATAAVTEEVLFRGYAIGVGQSVLGGPWQAFALSLVVFVAAHFRWGVGHLLTVLWAGAMLSLLFVATGSLVACIVAHFVVDAVGVFIAPWAIAARARRLAEADRKAVPP
jgi:membrane protease YdiL (CAAX protease family)